jgi:hypothetical protein
MIRCTSWSGRFCSLYSATMISRYLSHGFVMACQHRRGSPVQQLDKTELELPDSDITACEAAKVRGGRRTKQIEARLEEDGAEARRWC